MWRRSGHKISKKGSRDRDTHLQFLRERLSKNESSILEELLDAFACIALSAVVATMVLLCL